jgi:thioredoxin reductase
MERPALGLCTSNSRVTMGKLTTRNSPNLYGVLSNGRYVKVSFGRTSSVSSVFAAGDIIAGGRSLRTIF